MIKKAAIIYWSKTGNTRKVANAIKEGLLERDIDIEIMEVNQAQDVDFLNYDLVCLGTPAYHWSPPQEVDGDIRGLPTDKNLEEIKRRIVCDLGGH